MRRPSAKQTIRQARAPALDCGGWTGQPPSPDAARPKASSHRTTTPANRIGRNGDRAGTAWPRLPHPMLGAGPQRFIRLGLPNPRPRRPSADVCRKPARTTGGDRPPVRSGPRAPRSANRLLTPAGGRRASGHERHGLDPDRHRRSNPRAPDRPDPRPAARPVPSAPCRSDRPAAAHSPRGPRGVGA